MRRESNNDQDRGATRYSTRRKWRPSASWGEAKSHQYPSMEAKSIKSSFEKETSGHTMSSTFPVSHGDTLCHTVSPPAEETDIDSQASQSEPLHLSFGEDATSALQKGSSLLLSDVGGTEDSEGLGIVQTKPSRRYRINKRSAYTATSSWLGGNQLLLEDVLQQERLAWLSPSSSDVHSLAKHYNSQPGRHGSEEGHDQGESSDADFQQEQGLHLPQTRKSQFLEGSMSQGSKAVASTWYGLTETPSSADITHLDNDDEATPRPSFTASTTSSIDVNEFKPLPATPSTIKNTLKGFGRRLKHTESFEPSAMKETPHSPRDSRKGLRKSISSWKMFSNSTSDIRSNTPSEAENEDCPSVKKTSPSKTLRSRIGFSRVETRPSQKSVLDDRKRKAEAIYAEQFSATKKPRQGELQKATQPTDQFNAQTATVRRSSLRGRAVERERLHHDSEAPTVTAVCSTTSGEPTLVPCDSPPRIQVRTSSRRHTNNGNLETDRLKRATRSELEKENQQLRSLLQESQHQAQSYRSRNRSLSPSRSSTNRHSHASRPTSTSSNWQVHEDKKECEPTLRDSELRPPSRKMAASPARKDMLLEHVQAVPSASKSSPSREVLASTDGNLPQLQNTGTVKYRGSAPRVHTAIQRPRPLSMVLECMENGDGIVNEANTGCVDKVTSSQAQTQGSYDGTAESKVNSASTGLEKKGLESTHVSTGGEWEWPEDVF